LSIYQYSMLASLVELAKVTILGTIPSCACLLVI